jgi:outer membrane biosynthesis protein TonB
MTSQRILMTVAIAVCLAYASGAPVAQADPTSPPAADTKKKPAAAPAKPKPAPKPTPPPKEPAKRPSPEAAAAMEAPKPRSGASAAHEVVEHESRIEFDERMVRGQSAAGAIFLFQRTPSDLKSIVEIPSTFRPKTVELVQPHRGTP